MVDISNYEKTNKQINTLIWFSYLLCKNIINFQYSKNFDVCKKIEKEKKRPCPLPGCSFEAVRKKRNRIDWRGTYRGSFETFSANLLWFCSLSLDVADMWPFTAQYKSHAKMHLASQLCLNRIKISISWVEIRAERKRAHMPAHGGGENPISCLSSPISPNLWPPLWHINTQQDLLKGIYVTRLDFLLGAGWDLIRVDFNLGLGLSALILHRKYSNTLWLSLRPVTRCLNLTS